jgi:hypothetical protein
MAMPNVKVTYEVKPDSCSMLSRIAKIYNISDESKVLRCLLDYTAMEGDWDDLFSKIRCCRCG